MSVFAHSHLFLGPSTVTVVSGPYIQVLDVQNGAILHTTKTDEPGAPSPILCATVDDAHKHVVSVSDDKKLHVRALPTLQLLSEREVPKKPTSVILTRDASTILTADKFGDVHRYPLHPPSVPATSGPQPTADDDAENDAPSTLVLGHTSLLTDVLLSQDEKYLLTADRDEHIRVSWFPQGYIIERYCLGHTKFVSAIHIPPSSPTHLISGGGDPALKIWDWHAGTVLAEIPILDAIVPHIAVFPNRERKPVVRKDGKPHGRKGRKKAKQRAEEAARAAEEASAKGGQGADGEEDAMDAEQDDEGTPAVEGAARPDAGPEPVLVIQRISAVSTGSESTSIIFSAVGATALFSASFSVPDPSTVHATPLGAPVLDFAIASDGRVWVLLDATRGPEGGSSVKVLYRSNGSELVEDSTASPLLQALNTTALVPTTADELAKIEHYTALSSYPKIWDGAEDTEGGVIVPPDAEPGDAPARPVGQAPARGKHIKQRQKDGPTVREEARKKLREKVSERMKAQVGTGTPVAGASGTATPELLDEPAEKKARVEGEEGGEAMEE